VVFVGSAAEEVDEAVAFMEAVPLTAEVVVTLCEPVRTVRDAEVIAVVEDVMLLAPMLLMSLLIVPNTPVEILLVGRLVPESSV
jgi:hypothetical protein